MFFYHRGDLLGFYEPGVIEQIIAGKIWVFQINQAFLLGVAILMTIPVVMIFLSLTLKPSANRWANIILGIVYIVVVLIPVLSATYAYYIFLSIVEIVLTALIVWYAWKWPKQEA